MKEPKTPKAKNRTRGRPLIVDAALIVLSVLLGLMANEWRVSWASQREADEALRAIREEIRSNYEQVEGMLSYRESMKDSLAAISTQVLAERGVEVSATMLFGVMPQGFSVTLLQNNAWEVANSTGVARDFDLDLTISLSHLYDTQAFYQAKLDMIGHNLYIAGNIEPNNLAATTVALTMLANDIFIQEKKLEKMYPALIERLDALDL